MTAGATGTAGSSSGSAPEGASGVGQGRTESLDPLALAPVLPVVEIDDAAHAVPLARALLAGGLPVLEVTLRTPAAPAAIAAIAAEVPEVVVGAGTLRRPADVDIALAAGARFLVSPGTPGRLREAFAAVRSAPGASGVPCLPGASTVTEVLELLDAGFTAVKVFPAAALGGVAFLRSLVGPVADVRVCPTGGITATSAPEYLTLPQVPCVGGTWVARRADIARSDWAAITTAARAAAALSKP